jgi:hypothetical protein
MKAGEQLVLVGDLERVDDKLNIEVLFRLWPNLMEGTPGRYNEKSSPRGEKLTVYP